MSLPQYTFELAQTPRMYGPTFGYGRAFFVKSRGCLPKTISTI